MKVINIMTGRRLTQCGVGGYVLRPSARPPKSPQGEPQAGGLMGHGGMERPANHVCVPCSHVNCHTHVNIRYVENIPIL